MSGARAGFHFRERMAGWVSTRAKTSPVAGAHQGEADRQWAELVLDVDYDDLEELLRENDTAAHLRGSALVAGLSPVAMQIVDGTLRLFVHDTTHVQTWRMKYAIELRSEDGSTYRLTGEKLLRRGSVFTAWPRTTTLSTTVRDADGDVVAQGILRLTLPDFLRQLSTMRVTRTRNPWTRLTGRLRFLLMFLKMMVRQFGGLLAGPWGFPLPPLPPPRGRPKQATETYWCTGDFATPAWKTSADDGAWLRLTRYSGGSKGPVVLAPGFGMSTDAYVTDTIDENLTEFLMRRGFDVWLFDYRASPHLESVDDRFTIDDIARVDWPVAIQQVCDVTRARKVQVFAHCVGSMSFQMAMLWKANAAMRGQVRSAVCSQVTVHPVSTWFNTLKVRAGLGPVLEKMMPILEPEVDPTPLNILYDVILRIAPTPRGEGCGNSVCQWITAYFGLTHRHAQLNEATHDDLARLFGKAGVYPLRHIGNMVARGKALDVDGKDVYLESDSEQQPGNAGNLAIPILFLAGRHNRIFYPDTSSRTIGWLRSSNPKVPYDRVELEEYAHLDGIIGRSANVDVFPIVADYLEQPELVLAPQATDSDLI